MNRHTIRVLEFDKIRAELQSLCLTGEAEAALRKERVSLDASEVSAQIAASQSVRRCLQSEYAFPQVSFPETSEPLRRLEKEGAVLEPEELAAIATHARSSIALKDFYRSAISDSDSAAVTPLVEAIPPVGHVAEHVGRFVDRDGAVRERDIPELKRVRVRITQASQELQREAQRLLGQDDLRRYWNASVPTQRGGRTVLALKADHRGKVRGIIHEVSATGATVFIEPDVLVERNNAVTEAENAYRNELLRILRELSRFCAKHREDLARSVAAVAEIDRLYARARYAMAHDCVAAAVSSGAVRLRAARHPLLGDGAVPVSIEFPPGKQVLVITGPNTGGKTVTLKTVGLLAMMNQFGMEIPVSPGTELPVFSGIYADIGDEQSIEQSLSTFSGHMRNIGRVLSAADEHSLVLLDELGSGTDPEEGGALAMAILDELLERGSRTIVTTHHGVLKHYGFTQPAAANASVEFDMKSLRPTYRIVPGVPGSSHAIEVAAHMGILRTVTSAARSYLTGEEYDTGRIIRALTDTEQELYRERERIRETERELAREKARLEELKGELEARETELKRGRLRELEAWSAETRSKLENLVREVREGELTREKTRNVKQFMAETDDRLLEERRRLEIDGPARVRKPPTDAAPPGPGAEVRILSSEKRGVVQRRGKGDTWLVQIGPVRLAVAADDLEVIADRGERKPEIAVSSVSAHPVLELDIRGARLEDALQEVERQIDQALLGGMTRFGIIHGMGEGVLQKGVADLLRTHPHVRRFSFAVPEDGGFGKTVVELS